MIVAAAVMLALAAPSREALIERWLHANPTHGAARLEPAARTVSPAHVPANLRILAQHELGIGGRYQLTAPRSVAAATEPWWWRPLRWLGDRWQQFIHALFGRVHIGKEAAANIGDLLLFVIGLILLGVVIRLLRNVRLARAALRAQTEPLVEAPNPLSLYNRACDAARRGEYGNAALLLFGATVALLDLRGAVEARRSATVGDLRRGLRARDVALVAPFDAIAAPFVARAYAERSVDEMQWNRARDAFDRLAQAGAAP